VPPAPAPNHRLALGDRVLVTLVHLRFQLPHQALAVLYGVDRATITRAVHEIRPLLAKRGFAVPDAPGVRLHTLADVFAYAAAHGVDLRIDGTETQVRRPRANRPGRRAFVSGKKKQQHQQDHHHRRWPRPHLVGGGGTPGPPPRPDRGQDRGDRGPAAPAPDRQRHGGQRLPGPGQGVPRSGPRPTTQTAQGRAPAEELAAYQAARTQQSSRRICVEHAIAEPKGWRSLQRWIGRREYYAQTHLAVAGLVSDRAARR
jgi:Helix-turn-helix of DDE superfamily endonuclease